MSGRVALALIVAVILLYLAGAFEGRGIGDMPSDNVGIPPSVSRIYAQPAQSVQSAGQVVSDAQALAYCQTQHSDTLAILWCLTAFDEAVR